MKRALIAVTVVIMTVAASGAYNNGFGGPYPYLGEEFKTFVQDSYVEGHKGDAEQFYEWFRAAFAEKAPEYPDVDERDLQGFLDAEKARMDAIEDPIARTVEEIKLGRYMHQVVKKTILKFSLDRGFEFHALERTGERQCLLQAVLIAGLLQQMDVKAGVVMVYRNMQGDYSFNGHVTTLMRLSNGKDIMIDASDRLPFADHQGILAQKAGSGYRYLSPIYIKDSCTIVGYRTTAGLRVEPFAVSPLDTDYVRSQFYYYRGERAPGGIIAAAPTRHGLAASAYFLEKSVSLSPANSLAVDMLGRVYAAQGRPHNAQTQYKKALALQKAYGWVPPSIPEHLRG